MSASARAGKTIRPKVDPHVEMKIRKEAQKMKCTRDQAAVRLLEKALANLFS